MNKRMFWLLWTLWLSSMFLVSCGGGDEKRSSADAGEKRRTLEAPPYRPPPQLTATWAELPSAGVGTGAGGPGGRVWTEMTWDSLRGEIVIFGGNGPQLYDNDIWSYKVETGAWTLIDPFTYCPGNSGFSKINGTDDTNFKYDPFNNLYWAFGGASGYRCIGLGESRTAGVGSGSTVVVDPALSSSVDGEYIGWSVSTPNGTARVVAYSASARTLTLGTTLPTLVPGTPYRLYATNGAGVWFFDPVTGVWTGQGITPGDTTSIPTQGRIAAAVDYSTADHAFVLWGGLSMGSDRRAWKLDASTKQWTVLPVPVTGAPAHRREMLNSFVYDKANGVFVLFGGVCSYSYDPACPEGAVMGETWVYRLSTNTWTNMNPAGSPPARAQQVMTYDDEHGVIVLFGGSTGTGDVNDTWVYHYPSNSWTQLATAAAPAPRRLAQAAYNPVTRQTILFGGRIPGVGISGDIWALKLIRADTVNAPPLVSLSAPAAGATYTAPASITLSANASDSDGSVARVEFYAGATKIGEATSAPYQMTWTGVAAGSYSLSARATDNQGASTNSTAVAVSVAPPANVAPSVSLISPAAGATYTAPASITLSANASDSDGSIARVEFYAGATKIGEATSAPYQMTWTGVAAGSYSLSARATDNQGASTNSTAVAVSVAPPANVAPSVSLISPAAGATYTAPASITLSANASDSDGSIARVEFYAGATKIGERTAAPYTLAWSNVAAGGYSLTAVATDNAGASTVSTVVGITVNPPAGGGGSINVAAQVNGGVASASSAYSSAYPVSAVNDGNRLGNRWAQGGGWNDASASSFPDWVQINFAGTRTINRIDVFTLPDNYAAGIAPTQSTTFSLYGITDFTVQYWNGTAWVTVPGGNVSNNNLVWRSFTFPAVSTDRIRVTVTNALYWYSRILEIEAWTDASPANVAPSVSLSAPAAGATYTAPASITLSANASDVDGSIAKVEFYAGSTKLGERTAAPYTLTWSNVAAGSYVLTAVATDNAGASTSSAPVAVTVAPPANVAPSVNLTSPAAGATYTAPASITLSANASDVDGSIAKVEFYAGSTKLGERTAAPYTLTWSNVAAGSYVLTAVATDNAGASTSSSPVAVTVSPPANVAPSVSLSAPAAGATYTAPASITLSANASDVDGSIAKVEFYAGSTKLGERTAAPYTLTWSNVAAGSYVLTAVATDNAGASTGSAGVNITVNPSGGGGGSINVAAQVNGGVASASSAYSSAYPVSAINDGNRLGNRWAEGGGWNDASASSFPDWVQINFAGTRTINRIEVFTLPDNYAAGLAPTQSTTFSLYGITDFAVQYWSGAAWVTVPGGNVSKNNLVWRSFTFPAISTDRIRVTVTNALYWYSRILEIEAWAE